MTDNRVNNILVSFIVIAYNEEKNIQRTLNSIISQYDIQSYEVIVVNDGSIDNTRSIVMDFGRIHDHVRLVDQIPNAGRGPARALGVLHSQGEYVAFVDADILLPDDWLRICLKEIEVYDAVGGTAVPDGDVSYIYKTFSLEPKIVKHSTTVTGSNGLFRSRIFKKVNFDSGLKDGEDVAFNHALVGLNARLATVPDLIVRHEESKTFSDSVNWLYQSGRGAARQLRRYKKIRTPDLVFLLFFISSLIVLAVSIILRNPLYVGWIIIFPAIISVAQVSLKFRFNPQSPLGYFMACFVHSLLIFVYLIGRTRGLVETT